MMSAPDTLMKGVVNGNCNRTACQQPGAVWLNESTRAYYCRNCAITIQQEENNWAFRAKTAPMELFKGIFDPTDPRHAVRLLSRAD